MEQMSLIDWLDRELAERGWNDHQLAQHAGISHSVISKARRGTMPRWDACAAIAAALNVPADLIFRQAGLLPPMPEEEAALLELRLLLPQLSPRDRLELVQIARLKIHLHTERQARRASRPSPGD
jgi:transcriptional regulator with XRE-family HTH domain